MQRRDMVAARISNAQRGRDHFPVLADDIGKRLGEKLPLEFLHQVFFAEIGQAEIDDLRGARHTRGTRRPIRPHLRNATGILIYMLHLIEIGEKYWVQRAIPFLLPVSRRLSPKTFAIGPSEMANSCGQPRVTRDRIVPAGR